jgi:hypothetical protein|tara:strand:+ start:307 stop:723 length:417 start_codon:yes stop_codon:yes gene_type:complete
MAKLVHEVLTEVGSRKRKTDRIQILKQNESWALKDIIRGSMDSTVEWNLPGGDPPYTPCEDHNAPTNLLRENKQFRYFVKGGPGDKMNAPKRENIFIGLIEGIHPSDAKLVVDMINGRVPKGLTREIVQEAFPGLLKD